MLFTRLRSDNSNSLTYNPEKGQGLTLARANCVILYLMQTGFNNSNLIIVTWTYEDIFSSATSA